MSTATLDFRSEILSSRPETISHIGRRDVFHRSCLRHGSEGRRMRPEQIGTEFEFRYKFRTGPNPSRNFLPLTPSPDMPGFRWQSSIRLIGWAGSRCRRAKTNAMSLLQARDDYYRSGQMEGTHRSASTNQSSRSSSHHPSAHQFGPSADFKLQSAAGRGGPGANQPRKHKRPGNTVPAERLHQQQQQQHQQHISFSSSEDEELRSTSECTSCDEHESEKGKVSDNNVLRTFFSFFFFREKKNNNN